MADVSTDQINELTGGLILIRRMSSEPTPATDETIDEITKNLPWKRHGEE